jgi:hypothetical protein
MYPSGIWRGFWEQSHVGRQPMDPFELYFEGGEVTGAGIDMVGRFVFAGTFDERTGHLGLVKQYLGAHQVRYDGRPDGEGCIHGTWRIAVEHFGTTVTDEGNFAIWPELPKPTGDEPIVEIKKSL